MGTSVIHIGNTNNFQMIIAESNSKITLFKVGQSKMISY